MREPSLLRRVAGRLRTALPDAAAATAAAALAWLLARALLGHPQPVFASVAAIICLAPGLPNHGRQAVGLTLGVATGIAIGQAALLVPELAPAARLSVATFVAIMIASTYGLLPVVAIQAGVSALLVLALGADSAGWVRMLDVVCGAAVGLLFSQVLFTPHPVRLLIDGERALLVALAEAFRGAQDALAAGDANKAQAALRRFSDAHIHVAALAGGIDTARSAATWSLRGRLVRRDLRVIADQFGRRSTRAYAAALLFGSALAAAIQRASDDPPAGLAPGIATAIRLCDLDKPSPPAQPALTLDGQSDDWRRCSARLDETMSAIRELRASELPGKADRG